MLEDTTALDYFFAAVATAIGVYLMCSGLRYHPKPIPEGEAPLWERERKRSVRFAWVLIPTGATLVFVYVAAILDFSLPGGHPIPSRAVLFLANGLFVLGAGMNRYFLARGLRESLTLDRGAAKRACPPILEQTQPRA